MSFQSPAGLGEWSAAEWRSADLEPEMALVEILTPLLSV